MIYYTLAADGQTPVACKDVIEWAKFFEDSRRRIIKQDYFGNVMVSTVFLGIDHNFFGDGPPVLWETMIFGGVDDGWQERSFSHKMALSVHDLAVAQVKHNRLWPVILWRFIVRISSSISRFVG